MTAEREATKKVEPVPLRIGDYRVERLLGEGGMGKVFLCHDDGLDRKVAVKVLQESLAKEPEMAERFLREARAMAKVSSPHVVTVHQVVARENEAPHIVMEVLDGADLSDRVREGGPLGWREAVDVTVDAVAGLKAAWAVGIVHRDVKPANLFLTKAGCKLTDFGLARPIDGSADLTQAGILVGTPHYLAPELARGGQATVQSDIYALGATLYRMLTGRPPYDDEAPLAVITKHITEPPPRLSDAADVKAPAALSQLIERMMAKSPADRPESYEQLEELLQAVQEERSLPRSTATGETAPPELLRELSGKISPMAATLMSRVPALAEKSRRRPVVIGAAALLGGVLLFFLVSGGGDLATIDDGDPQAVLAKLEERPASARPGEDDLLRGHAFAKLKRETDAVAAYTTAAKKGASDARARDFLLSMLDYDEANDVIRALGVWPDDVDGKLRGLLASNNWYERQHALRALKARKALRAQDEERVAIKDIRDGESCDRRRHGLVRLKRVAESDEAFEAMHAAGKRMPDNLCMSIDLLKLPRKPAN